MWPRLQTELGMQRGGSELSLNTDFVGLRLGLREACPSGSLQAEEAANFPEDTAVSKGCVRAVLHLQH